MIGGLRGTVAGRPRGAGEHGAGIRRDHDYLTEGGVFPERLITQLIDREAAASSKISRLPHPMEFAMYYDI